MLCPLTLRITNLYEDHFLLKAGWVYAFQLFGERIFTPGQGSILSLCGGHHGNWAEPWESMAAGPQQLRPRGRAGGGPRSFPRFLGAGGIVRASRPFWSAQGSLNHRLTLLKSSKFYFTENCPISFQPFADVPASSF